MSAIHLTGRARVTYFSHVFGVLSLKSSITRRPAGSEPIVTSRKHLDLETAILDYIKGS